MVHHKPNGSIIWQPGPKVCMTFYYTSLHILTGYVYPFCQNFHSLLPMNHIIVQITLIWIERILETKMYWSVTVKSNSYQIMWVSAVGYREFTALWQYWLWHFMFYRCWNLKNVLWIMFFPFYVSKNKYNIKSESIKSSLLMC